jgi:DNA-binding transcriptional ArsR family regulator
VSGRAMQWHVERFAEHRRLLADACHAERVAVRAVMNVHELLCWRHRERDDYVDETVDQIAEALGESPRIVRRALVALDRVGLWRAVVRANQYVGTRRVPGFETRGYPQQQRPPERSSQAVQRPPERSQLEPVRVQRPPERSQLNGSTHVQRPQQRPQQRPLGAHAATAQAVDTKDQEQRNKARPPSRAVLTSEPTNAPRVDEISEVMADAVRLLVRHRDSVYGAPGNPEATRRKAERDCAVWRDDAQAWLADGRRPYDIARSVAARANGETTSRPPSRAELGLS